MDFLVHHMLRASALRFPQKEALVHQDRRLSYEQMWEQTAGLAAGLQAAGTRRADRVGVLLEPSIPLAVSLFGISRAGGVFVPIHQSLFPNQVEHIVRDCEMRGIIIDADRFAKLRAILQERKSLEFVVVVGKKRDDEGRLVQFGYEELCHGAPAKAVRDVAISKDLAGILYTSGSTGKPKGVMLSHANVVAGASIVSDYLQITDGDRILAVLPFSFDAGLNQLMTAIQQGGTCVLLKFLFAKEIVAILAKERITGLAGVPSLWNLLSQTSSKLHESRPPHLRYITNTGGAMPLNVLFRLRELLPETNVVLMYGLTEAFRSTYLPPEEVDRRPTSMGRAIPDTEILVVNEDGELCRPGEIGELVHRGPTVSLGYWGHPELTDRVLRPDPFRPSAMGDQERVCFSGDLVKTDEDGFLYFVGRRDNLIKSSGFRISPTEVEAGLCNTGKLRDAAVIGLPDETLGQQIKAFVVPREGTTVDADELLEDVATLLPRHMIPKTVEVLSELPKTASGKVDYPKLRQRETVGPTASAASRS
jgi:acyl-CoA ligase (AMP-forming) (exosortase A-associated)